MKYLLLVLLTLTARAVQASPGFYFDSNLQRINDKSVLGSDQNWQIHPPVQWQTQWHLKEKVSRRAPAAVRPEAALPVPAVKKSEAQTPAVKTSSSAPQPSPLTCEMSLTSHRRKAIYKYSCNSLQALKAVENRSLASN